MKNFRRELSVFAQYAALACAAYVLAFFRELAAHAGGGGDVGGELAVAANVGEAWRQGVADAWSVVLFFIALGAPRVVLVSLLRRGRGESLA